MLRTMLRLLMGLSLPLLGAVCLWTLPAQGEARTLNARIARVATGVARLERVQVRLAWPDGAAQGELELRAGRIDAPDLGYRDRWPQDVKP